MFPLTAAVEEINELLHAVPEKRIWNMSDSYSYENCHTSILAEEEFSLLCLLATSNASILLQLGSTSKMYVFGIVILSSGLQIGYVDT